VALCVLLLQDLLHTHTHTHSHTHTYTQIHTHTHTHTRGQILCVCGDELSLSHTISISLSLGVPACVSGGGDDLLAGAEENSWQSRPRHACASSAFHTPSSQQPPSRSLCDPTASHSHGAAGRERSAIERKSAAIWSLQRAVALRARILTWAAPTTVQKHCPRKRHTLMAGSIAYAHGRHC
jgi:hypothetical protein